ncbi:hypothetical protein [Brevibacillus sp. FIR094]|uniref:hypothetical protein n=1 Tax=Brevibacillus sp. FIR094 TaxID=3134809 RepID=UPI003D2497E7
MNISHIAKLTAACSIGFTALLGSLIFLSPKVEAEQTQNASIQSPLFNRLSTDGKSYSEYIEKYSPVIYQDVNANYDERADLLWKLWCACGDGKN